MDEEKTKITNEINDMILRLSKQEPPLLDLIGQLERLKIQVEMANREEPDEILLWWADD